MNVERLPIPSLQPYVKFLWASDESGSKSGYARERMLPTGSMHVVFRLTDDPIRIFNSVEDRTGHVYGCGVVAGLRSRYYVKHVSPSVRTVGAVLQPGAAQFLFGHPAMEFAEQHVSIDDLWSSSARQLREQMKEQADQETQLHIFESFLQARVPESFDIHPVVAYALKRFPAMDVAQVVHETGYSHKQFIQLFRKTVGLTPKLYCRILRFQQVLKMVHEQHFSPIDIALQAEYSDQAHFNREFRDFAGITPGDYRVYPPAAAHHVPIKR